MYHHIVYASLINPYARFVLVINGQVWDVTNGVLSYTPTWGDTDTALPSDAYIGGIPITIPAALPAGEYDLLIYDAAEPASSDAVEIGLRIQWTGSQLLGLPVEFLLE